MSSSSSYELPDEKAFNLECPICFENEGDMFLLSCLHRFHVKCLEKHTDFNCPQCRQPVINWPISIKEKIEKNSLQFKTEIVESERQAMLQHQRMRQNRELSMIFQPPPHYEVMAALQFLKDQGIPMRYLCRKMKINVQKNGPKVSGQIFSTIIASIKDEIEKEIEEVELQEDEIEMGDTEDNPFENENDLLEATANPSVNFVNME